MAEDATEYLRMQLILDVKYKLNGTTEGDLIERLLEVGNRAFDEGLVTGITSAEVVEFEIEVAAIDELEVPEDFSNN